MAVRIPQYVAQQGLETDRGGVPNTSVDQTLPRAIEGLGGSISDVGDVLIRRQEAQDQFTATKAVIDWTAGQQKQFQDTINNVQPGQAVGFAQGWDQGFRQRADQFITTLPRNQQQTAWLRIESARAEMYAAADKFETGEQQRYAAEGRDQTFNSVLLPRVAAAAGLPAGDPNRQHQLDLAIHDAASLIDADPSMTAIQKDEARRAARTTIQTAFAEALPPAERAALRPGTASAGGAVLADGDKQAFRDAAAQLGISPVDLAAAVSYETGGTFDPNIKGGKGGAYEGLIQFGPVERQRYGFREGMSVADQLRGPVVAYLKDRGLKPGMGLPELYSIINAGSLDRYGRPRFSRSDGNGTVAQHIARIEADHVPGAAAMLGDSGVTYNGNVASGSPRPGQIDLPDLHYDDRIRIADSGDRDLAVARRTYLDGLPDELAWIRAGNPPTGRYSEAAVASATGDAGMTADVGREVGAAVNYAQTAQAVKFASPDELNQIVGAAQQMPASPDNFREWAQQSADIIDLVNARQQGLQKDPAGWAQQDPTVSAAWQHVSDVAGKQGSSWSDVQQATDAYAGLSLRLQDHMGVPAPMQRLLSPGATAGIAMQYQSAAAQGGQNAVQYIRALRDQWGKNWPRVFSELADKLPPTAMVIGAMDRPEQQFAAERLAEAAAVGRKTLEAALPEGTTPAKIDNAVTAAMSDFQGTLAPLEGFGANTYSAFHEAIGLLATADAAGGTDATVAAQRAYQAVLGDAYTMKDTYRVPIQYDAGRVEAGAGKVLAGLTGDGIDLPTSLAGLNEAETRDQYLSALKANGFWVTAPDESGLMLYDLAGGSGAAVTRNGAPVIVPWADLIAAAPPTGGFLSNFNTPPPNTTLPSGALFPWERHSRTAY